MMSKDQMMYAGISKRKISRHRYNKAPPYPIHVSHTNATIPKKLAAI